jgi:hypothetical protein
MPYEYDYLGEEAESRTGVAAALEQVQLLEGVRPSATVRYQAGVLATLP